MFIFARPGSATYDHFTQTEMVHVFGKGLQLAEILPLCSVCKSGITKSLPNVLTQILWEKLLGVNENKYLCTCYELSFCPGKMPTSCIRDSIGAPKSALRAFFGNGKMYVLKKHYKTYIIMLRLSL